MLIGYSRAAESYIDRLLAHPEWGFSIHGILDNHKPFGHAYRNVPVIGRIDELEKMLPENDYDEIAITLGINHYDSLEQIVAITEKSGVHTKFIPDYNNIIPTRPYTEDLDGLPVIHVRKVPLSNSFNRFLKRTFDIFGSLLLILLFSIPMAVVAAIIKATSPGHSFLNRNVSDFTTAHSKCLNSALWKFRMIQRKSRRGRYRTTHA